MQIAEIIDDCTDGVETESAPDTLEAVHLLARLMAQGLHDIDDALYRLMDSYRKANIRKEAA